MRSLDVSSIGTGISTGGEAAEDAAPECPVARSPRIVAVVPVRDGGEDVALCLAGLAAAGQPAADVLVVDDGSRDGAARRAASRFGTGYCRLEAKSGRPNGPARARNHGVHLRADADIVLFVDADVVVHPDAVRRFAALMLASPDTVAAFGSYDDAPPAPDWISQYKNLLHHHMHQSGRAEACTFWAGCGAVRRDAFVAAGGFDGDCPIEDVELGLRLSDAAHRIRLDREILCTHRKRWSLASWLRTDIFTRALPWSRLLVERGRGVPDSLNLGHRERLSAAFALLVVGCLPMLAFAPILATEASLVALSAFALSQRSLLRLFARRRGIAFAAAATLMHIVYFACASAVFVGVRLAVPITTALGPRCSRSAPPR